MLIEKLWDKLENKEIIESCLKMIFALEDILIKEGKFDEIKTIYDKYLKDIKRKS